MYYFPMINLSLYLKKDLIALKEKLRGKEEVLKKIAELLTRGGYVKREDEAFSELKRREEIQSTGIGGGIAVPHLLCPLEEPVVGFLTLASPVEFDAVDGKPVDVVFFTAAPNPNLHLRMLARLARLVKSSSLIERIRKAETPEEAYEAFKQEEISL